VQKSVEHHEDSKQHCEKYAIVLIRDIFFCFFLAPFIFTRIFLLLKAMYLRGLEKCLGAALHTQYAYETENEHFTLYLFSK